MIVKPDFTINVLGCLPQNSAGSDSDIVRQHGPPNHLFVCFVALRPKSTAMVMVERSVYLTVLFSWASLNKQLTSAMYV